MTESSSTKQRQVVFWRLIGAAYGLDEIAAPFDEMTRDITRQLQLPSELLDGRLSIEMLLHRYPDLRQHFDSLRSLGLDEAALGEEEEEGEVADESDGDAPVADEEDDSNPAASSDPAEPDEFDLGRSLVYSKLLLNVFGPNTRGPTCSAAQYSQWCDDVGALEKCFGFAPGEMRKGRAAQGGSDRGGPGRGMEPSGGAPRVGDDQLREELVAMESDLIQRMQLREVLKDNRLAAQLSPSLSLIEQLLYDKSNLSGVALKNAKRLIKKYVDELAEVLKKQVISASSGEIDRSVPPTRVFRNLDLKRTVWKNLHHYNPDDEKLYVNELFYRHTSKKSLHNYLIVVVDQSGSMVDAMVQCAILASIFATLPRVEVSLIAYDTSVVDLSPWVADPFESLMRTNLGGGTYGPAAMEEARGKVIDARRTTMVWISDFYDDRSLFNMIKSVKESGVHFIPVGSVSGRGYFSVDDWFRTNLKKIGSPVLTGNIKKLIVELKKQLV